MTVSSDPFEVLGLDAKTATEVDVKRAYAAKLKTTRPDDDPEGFIRLREALEQARNRVRWRDEYGDDDDEYDYDDDAEDAIKDDSVYDDLMRSWVSNDPNGLVIQAASKWLSNGGEGSGDAIAAWTGFMDDPALTGVDEFTGFAHCVRCGLAGVSGYYGSGEDDKPARPDWLSDELIVLFHQRFGWHGSKETDAYAANLNNWLADLFDPVLQDKGLIAAPLERVDVRALEIAEIESERADDHGSYFDKDADEWVDMSPVAVALRKVETLAASPWAGASMGPWDAIINNPDLQTVDEFQEFSNRLRWFLCNASGIDAGDDSDPPSPPRWMTPTLIKHLDVQFGWSHQAGSEGWERRQNVWLGKLIDQARQGEVHAAKRGDVAERLKARELDQGGKSGVSPVTIGVYVIFAAIFLYMAWLLVNGLSKPPGT